MGQVTRIGAIRTRDFQDGWTVEHIHKPAGELDKELKHEFENQSPHQKPTIKYFDRIIDREHGPRFGEF